VTSASHSNDWVICPRKWHDRGKWKGKLAHLEKTRLKRVVGCSGHDAIHRDRLRACSGLTAHGSIRKGLQLRRVLTLTAHEGFVGGISLVPGGRKHGAGTEKKGESRIPGGGKNDLLYLLAQLQVVPRAGGWSCFGEKNLNSLKMKAIGERKSPKKGEDSNEALLSTRERSSLRRKLRAKRKKRETRGGRDSGKGIGGRNSHSSQGGNSPI